jgi:DNA repair protein RecN (Recombination protein N)
MLEEIRIQNFAIIDNLELSFASGLNVITGETGAGKSIIIDAVELLLGGKADAASVRAGAERAVVEGVFRLDERAGAVIMPILRQGELLAEGEEATAITISREVRANGRSTARVNGVTVNLEVLSDIGDRLIDVHGQSAHLSLLKPASHIDLLDRYADLIDVRAAMAALVTRLNSVRREIHHLLEDEAALKRRAELLRREVEEIEAAAPRPGEDDELKAERNRLSNSEQLAKLSLEALTLLYGDDTADAQLSAIDQLMQVSALLSKLCNIDPELKSQQELADEAGAFLEELSSALRHYVERIEFNPERLDEVEERLEVINTLKRRYGVSIELVLEYADKARDELNNLENSEERLADLRRQEEALLHHVGDAAERISRVRLAAAKHLSAGVVRELADLRMANARFEVDIAQQEDPEGCYVGESRFAFDETGVDAVEFIMSANPGEPLRQLAKVASGGEAARIMLALKRVLTLADHTPTLIFDEIDQGIGGRVGSVVGEKLWELTGGHQVMVVTHLAQLAGYADQHYRVQKAVDSGRTHTLITPLSEEWQRVEELAAMLGTVNESGFQSARELLLAAADYKRQQTTAVNGSGSEAPHQQSLL